MSERQTLAILGWTVGAIVGIAYIVDGLALSMP
jgi:hypothetical protein